MWIFKRVQARFRYNRSFRLHAGVLRLTEEGLQLHKYKLKDCAIELTPMWNLEWREVHRICGYKRDLITVDLICLAFESQRGVAEIHEEMEGYKAVIECLPSLFPGLAPRWWTTVAFPPFQTNFTTIWEAPGRTS